MDVLKDSYYIIGDVPATKIGNKERERVANCSLGKIREKIKYPLKKLNSDESTMEFYDSKQILLPVYIVNIYYNKKIYTYYMNGQTGEFVGNIPISKSKFILFTGLYLIIFAALALLISFIFFSMGG